VYQIEIPKKIVGMTKKSSKVKAEKRERLGAISEQRTDLDVDAPIPRAWQAAEKWISVFPRPAPSLLSLPGGEKMKE